MLWFEKKKKKGIVEIIKSVKKEGTTNISDLVQAIGHNMENSPEEWEESKCAVANTKRKICLWTANNQDKQCIHFKFYLENDIMDDCPIAIREHKFSIEEKKYLYNKYCEWKLWKDPSQRRTEKEHVENLFPEYISTMKKAKIQEILE